MPEFKLCHIGINPGASSAVEIAAQFEKVFALEVKEGKGSVFAGTLIEVMREDYLGKMGHIALGTPSIEGVIPQLQERGAELDMDTAKYDKEGKLKAVYIKGDFGGFAIHLLKV